MKNKKYGNSFFSHCLFQKFFILILEIKLTLEYSINNIIELGGKDFRYNRFSLNIKGDMVIDTTAYPGNNERRFFGLKKNGRPYFKDEHNKETPYYSFFVEGLENLNQRKIEGESHFIQITNQKNPNLHGKEYLLSFSRLDGYIELYDFENKNMSFVKTEEYYNVSIYSEVGTFIKANSHQSNVTFDYIISFIFLKDDKYRFYVIRCAFLSNNISKSYQKLYSKEKTNANRRISSCFQTDSQKIVCLYQHNDFRFLMMVLDQLNNKQFNTTLDSGDSTGNEINSFYKGIHFKKEIGFFVYYRSLNYKNPLFSLKYVNSTLGMNTYRFYDSLNISKSNFIGLNSLNDIIKLNDTRLCLISPTYNKEYLNIVIFNLYNDDYLLYLKYYVINFFDSYTIKFYKDLRVFLYNDFISLAFSHCNQSQCSETADSHYSSLIILNYPNSNDISIDMIQYLYSENKKIEDFFFNIEKQISYTIDNNIFGYEYVGIKILDYPDDINITYEDNSNIISKNTILENNKNLKIFFKSYKKKNYTIEYAVILKEPNYENIIRPNYNILFKSSNYYDTFYESNYYSQAYFTGKTSFFNITINENLSTECNDNCYLCYQNNISFCITCKYNYTFNNNDKTCYSFEIKSTIFTETSSIIKPSTTSTLSFLESTILSKQFSTIIETKISTEIQSEIPTLIKSTNPFSSNIISQTSNNSILNSLILSTIPFTISNSLNPTISSSTLNNLEVTTLKSSSSYISYSTINNIETSSFKSSTPSIETTTETSVLTSLNTNEITNTESSLLGTLLQSSDQYIKSTHLNIYTSLIENSTILYEKSSSSKLISSLISTEFPINNNTLSIIDLKSSLINSEMTTKSSLINNPYKTSSIEYISNIIHSNEIKCTKKTILEGKCNDIITNNQIEEIYKELTNEYILKNKTANISIVMTKNAIFQLSTIENQKNNSIDISSIDFGECEKEIKRKEGLSEKDDLIILKLDLKSNDLSSTYVQYEVYNPYTLRKIDMDICLNYVIKINVPVNLDPNVEELYNNLNEYGYNLFDSNDSFYNDICSTYTSLNGTDVTLTDRKNIIYNNNANVSLCQEGCEFKYYISSTKKINCECSPQKEEIKTNIDEIVFSNYIYKKFLVTLKNSNFFVMKCFKLIFTLKGQLNNIGSYIMDVIIFLIFILMILYCINGDKKIEGFIKFVISQKISFKNKENNSYSKQSSKKRKKENKEKNNKTRNVKIEEIAEESNIKVFKYKNGDEKIIKNNKTIKKRIKYNVPPKMKKSNNSNIKIKDNSSFSNNNLNNNYLNKSSSKISKLLKDKTNNINTKNNNIKIINKFNLSKNEIYNYFSDEELNTLKYEMAINIDHRTYWQYYCSLLKKKHIILFTFLKVNDYNLLYLKLSFFLLSFALYLTINAFFFTDKTMNKLYIDNGSYNFIFQIPQIILSSLISTVINVLLRLLSLSERNILLIKKENKIKLLEKRGLEIKKCLKNQFIIFFILSFSLLFFFWYFISCFCAVYKNTQKALLKDTLFSYALSMLYPFIIYLLPGLFRIPALKTKDKLCLYEIGNLLSLI